MQIGDEEDDEEDDEGRGEGERRTLTLQGVSKIEDTPLRKLPRTCR